MQIICPVPLGAQQLSEYIKLCVVYRPLRNRPNKPLWWNFRLHVYVYALSQSALSFVTCVIIPFVYVAYILKKKCTVMISWRWPPLSSGIDLSLPLHTLIAF